MAVNELREAVRAELQADVGIEFVSGAIPEDDVPVMRRDRGYVWVDGFARDPDMAIWEETTVQARVYLQYVEARSDEEPVDPAPLEDLAEQLRDALQNKRSLTDSSGTSWLLRFVSADLDYETMSVVATVMAGRPNPYET